MNISDLLIRIITTIEFINSVGQYKNCVQRALWLSE